MLASGASPTLAPDEWELLGALVAHAVAERAAARVHILGARPSDSTERLRARVGTAAETPDLADADVVVSVAPLGPRGDVEQMVFLRFGHGSVPIR